jgi:putative ABC transport system permease protein
MNAVQIALAQLKERRFDAALTVALIAACVVINIALPLVNLQLDRLNYKIAKDIDLIVIAKTAPMLTLPQLISQTDDASHMSLHDVNVMRSNLLVSWSVPVSAQDNFRGFPLVGTEQKFSFLYGATLEDGGSFWGTPYDVVLGADVAKHTGLDLGDHFKAAHSHSRDGGSRADDYVVTGILRPTGNIIDRLILTSMESLWDSSGTQSVAALLLRTKSLPTLQTLIEQNSKLQTVRPKLEAVRLSDQRKRQFKPVQWSTFFILFLPLLRIFLFDKDWLQRRRNFAMLRVIGATPRMIFKQVFLEGFLLAAIGTLIGFVLAHLGIEILAWRVSTSPSFVAVTGFEWAPNEWLVLLIPLVLGALAALYPARKASRILAMEAFAS